MFYIEKLGQTSFSGTPQLTLHNGQTTRNYYIDESGSTGDLAKLGSRFDFGQQQVFTLAALGIDDSDAMGQEITRLKTSHGVQASELKSTSIRDKPTLISDLAMYIAEKKLPLMIEVVDKRFMIAANIINTLVLPPVGEIDLTPESHFIRNVMAEYLSALAPSMLFESYVTACDAFSSDSVNKAFEVLLTWLAERPANDEVSAGIKQVATDSRNDFRALKPDDYVSQRRYLPLPDHGKRGQSVWMLPNLTSFTNIYARINRRHARRIANVTLFHDENAHFDQIISTAKRDAEDLAKDHGVPLLPFSDYHFEEEATLIFTGSHVSPGIQASDVLAGFVMRYVRDSLYGEHPPSEQHRKAFFDILASSDPKDSTGINFVLPTRDVFKLGVIPAQGGFSP